MKRFDKELISRSKVGNISVKQLALALFFGLLTLSSCKTTNKLTGKGEEHIRLNTKQILQKVKEHNYTFEGLKVNRINCLVEAGGKKTSFKGAMKAQCDEFIDITASKLIPILRAHLSSDTVQVISYLQKGYYEGDYDLVANQFGMLVNYQFIQSILTGSFSELKENKLRASSFDCYIYNDNYVLKWKDYKVFGDGNVFTQYVYINPLTYQIDKLCLVSVLDKNTKLTVNYSNHLEISGQWIPTKLNVEAQKGKTVVKTEMQFSRIELNPVLNNNFTISNKYQKLN
ncbi:MAG: DUF4292 domain-containing protein [Mangrovibacterium sp.]